MFVCAIQLNQCLEENTQHNTYIRKQGRSQIKQLSFHLNKLEIEDYIKLKQVDRKNNEEQKSTKLKTEKKKLMNPKASSSKTPIKWINFQPE